ncbi:carboxypeptidase regulatory-like domain-containing protein [Aquabacterium humicola]|uniref:carboxypeptidase regulatory-like domain-containing protein n=1 Tax=Aquabacterium humicola TaxID=3237377 RepID=UPI00254332C3|nr:carboxypeptidase regulatory-like domain-containing protein [Rubrivivax pictus]
MNTHRLAPWLAGALALAIAGSTLAGPAADQQGAVRSLSGGIGADEARAMKEAAPGYPLALTFSRPDGAFVADISLRVRDAGGRTVYEAKGVGPMVLLDMPAGRYVIEATHPDGRQQQRSVSLDGKRHAAVSMTWAG